MTYDQPTSGQLPRTEQEIPSLKKHQIHRKHREKILDEALMDTFPASDPIELAAESPA